MNKKGKREKQRKERFFIPHYIYASAHWITTQWTIKINCVNVTGNRWTL